MRDLFAGLVDLALPPACCRCSGPVAGDRALCPGCRARLPAPPPEPPPPGLLACAAAAAYAGDVVDWVRRFKYPRPGISGFDPAADGAVHALVREAAETARRGGGPRPDLLVPVPLHPRRLRARGFNPAALLARTAGRALGVPVDCGALMRIRDTPSQTGRGRAARRRNVRGAFRARPGVALPAAVCLVDDVVTTGSTLAAAARALRRGGARRVTAICAARTP